MPTNYTIADAIALIEEFTWDEYNQAPDLSDLSHIGLAYTDLDTNGKHYEVQVYADLINFRIVTEYTGDDTRTEIEQYNGIDGLIEYELKYLYFDTLVQGIFDYENMEA